MKKTRKRSKLRLSRTEIRTLNASQVIQVVGGSVGCITADCVIASSECTRRACSGGA